MSELEKVKSSDVTLKLGGRDRKIKFGFSAWAKLEEKYGGIKNLSKMEQDLQERPFATIPYLVWIGLSDKEGLTEETVLDDYSMQDIVSLSETLASVLYGSLPKDEEEKKVTENR